MKFQQGYSSLLLVLILSAVGTLVVAGLLLRGAGEARQLSVEEWSSRAHAAATACAEYAVYSLQDSSSYGGNETLNVSGDTCHILATGGTGNKNRTVRTTSTVEGTTRYISIFISNLRPSVLITSWQDVVSF